jgi:RND family efflux transporter MFP subunit
MQFFALHRVASVLGFALILAGCAHKPAEVPTAAPTPVMVSHPVEREVTDFADFTGRVTAVDSVEVRARVGGYLAKVNFKEGALVKQGDVLFEIDPRPYQAQVNHDIGQIATNEAVLKRARADNARNKAVAARSPGAVTQQELDQFQASEDEALGVLETSRATLENSQLNLAFTKVTSPVNGRVSRYFVTVGNLVVQDQSLLTTIVSVDPMYVYFDVDENTVLRVRQLIREGKAKSARDPGTKLPVLLGLENEKGMPHQGIVDFVDNQINPRTGTLHVRGVFPNQDESLAPGYFARVRVPIGQPHKALLVSDRAIDTDQGQKIVYVVSEKNEVVSRPIRTGEVHNGQRVIEEGIQPGERVIVTGLQNVRPGMTVESKVVDMPASTARGGEFAWQPSPSGMAASSRTSRER